MSLVEKQKAITRNGTVISFLIHSKRFHICLWFVSKYTCLP